MPRAMEPNAVQLVVPVVKTIETEQMDGLTAPLRAASRRGQPAQRCFRTVAPVEANHPIRALI
jgi:hypothetical protein